MKRMTAYLCRVVGVSRSGYYSWLAAEDRRQLRKRSDIRRK
ncbi:hypothetical protein [Paenibacillus sp. Soil766]|nr:hypothetical protein [Paenibacillus sp. Soil766]